MYIRAVDDDGARELIDRILAAGDRIRDDLRTVCDGLDLTDAQIGLLWRLAREPDGLTSRALADRLGCDASTVTSLVDRLERHGVVVRSPHPRDRRAKLVQLTPTGCELRDRADAWCRDASSVAALPPADRRTLADLLNRVLDPAGTGRAAGGGDRR